MSGLAPGRLDLAAGAGAVAVVARHVVGQVPLRREALRAGQPVAGLHEHYILRANTQICRTEVGSPPEGGSKVMGRGSPPLYKWGAVVCRHDSRSMGSRLQTVGPAASLTQCKLR